MVMPALILLLVLVLPLATLVARRLPARQIMRYAIAWVIIFAIGWLILTCFT
jgi:fumarate reductase subunit D